MGKTVCIPYRPDTPEREGNWARTRQQWIGWTVLTADSDGETFGRSQAINRAAAKAGDWDAIVVADSDLLLTSVRQAEKALRLAQEIQGYVMCYDTFYYLDEPTTQLVRAGAHPEPGDAYYSLTQVWLGTFAITRELWDAIGGFDEEFKSWGGEDGRFLNRMQDLGGRRDRIKGGCYHLKHPLVPGAR